MAVCEDKIPLTFWAMMIGTLAITGVGIPLTHSALPGSCPRTPSSKAPLPAAPCGSFAFWSLVIAAAMTSFYSWRLMFMTFWGEARGDMHAHGHAHESPRSMLAPLGVLAVGSVLAGMIWVGPFFGDHAEVEEFFGIPHAEGAEAHAGLGGPELMFGAALAATEAEGDDHGDKAAVDPENLPVQPGEGAIYMHPSNHTLDDAHHAPKWVKVSPFIAMLLGFGIALSMYMRGVPVLAKLGLGALGAVVLFVAKVPLALAILGGVVLAAIFC